MKVYAMADVGTFSNQNKTAVLTTMHGKEQVIVPLLERELGLTIHVASAVNTDQFGTFSGEVERQGSALDALRQKIAAGFKQMPRARIGLASEGSFGPHPSIPFLAQATDMVMLIDRDSELEIIGIDSGLETNYATSVVHTVDEAMRFAARAQFPSHGLIVTGVRNNQPDHKSFLDKEVTDDHALARAVTAALAQCGAALIQTDMRAHRNPTRMTAIERATRDLVRRFNSRCPQCNSPGFDVTQRIAGLPCADCGGPTDMIMTEIASCIACGYHQNKPATTDAAADPGQCPRCNP